MLTVEEALARCMTMQVARRVEQVSRAQSCGRVLAEDVRAAGPLPRWDNSAMDGYALRAADARPGARLPVVMTIPADSVGDQQLSPGQAARIMTGAPVPGGADTVVMQEHVTRDGDHIVLGEGSAEAGQHIRRVGEEIAAGQVVLSAGTEVTPAMVGLLAALGVRRVLAVKRPRVGLISTGDELVAPGRPLRRGQIWSSNADALAALVRDAGGAPVDLGFAPDTVAGTVAAFRRGLDAGCALLLSTGGVSVGDLDVVKDALADVGAEMVFWKVRVKPGKPLALGHVGEVPVFGLPGNPRLHHLQLPAVRPAADPQEPRRPAALPARPPRHPPRRGLPPPPRPK